jgi:hypothetical protein
MACLHNDEIDSLIFDAFVSLASERAGWQSKQGWPIELENGELRNRAVNWRNGGLCRVHCRDRSDASAGAVHLQRRAAEKCEQQG